MNTALQEDADAVGISVLSAAHRHIFAETARLMKERSLDDVVLMAGGIIPPADVQLLHALGVDGVFLPGASGPEIIEFLTTKVAEKRQWPAPSGTGHPPSSPSRSGTGPG